MGWSKWSAAARDGSTVRTADPYANIDADKGIEIEVVIV
jgi:hypothetical protein